MTHEKSINVEDELLSYFSPEEIRDFKSNSDLTALLEACREHCLTLVEAEILNYNFRPTDILYMKHEQNIDLPSFLGSLQDWCISKNDPEWQKYHIDNIIEKGGASYNGRIGSERTQFCKDCGKPVYFGSPSREEYEYNDSS